MAIAKILVLATSDNVTSCLNTALCCLATIHLHLAYATHAYLCTIYVWICSDAVPQQWIMITRICIGGGSFFKIVDLFGFVEGVVKLRSYSLQ